jgi:hypothetical protein
MYQEEKIKILCWCCKDRIETDQHTSGKAFCKNCETAIFHTLPLGYHERTLTVDEFIEQQQVREAEIFIKIVQRILDQIS